MNRYKVEKTQAGVTFSTSPFGEWCRHSEVVRLFSEFKERVRQEERHRKFQREIHRYGVTPWVATLLVVSFTVGHLLGLLGAFIFLGEKMS